MYYMLSDDAFVRLVAEDVKNRVSDEQKSYLRFPENNDRWKEALQALLSNLEEQIFSLDSREKTEAKRLQALGDDGVVLLAEMQTDIDSRRRKISRFKFHVESRLDEAERMAFSASDDSSDNARTVHFLREAIAKHRSLILENDFDYSDIDEALWSALSGHWEFDSISLGS